MSEPFGLSLSLCEIDSARPPDASPSSTTMKKLYRRGTVHPSPPVISDHLSFLPAAILTLAAALSPEDREVLAYLISCSNNFNTNTTSFSNCSGPRSKTAQKFGAIKGCSDHPPLFNCDCFRCYTSYWVRWDSSPNRQLIHEIIDAYEEGLAQNKSSKNNRKERKKKSNGSGSGELKGCEVSSRKGESRELDPAREGSHGGGGDGNGGGGGGVGCEGEDEMEKGSVRRIVNFIGERIWGAWT